MSVAIRDLQEQAAADEVASELVEAVYERPLVSTRCGPVFNAHSYPTKIHPDAIVPFILAHTQPGDLVFDGFAGSGSTAIAAALCADPPLGLLGPVEASFGPVNWGPRRALAYDISTLAHFIGSTLLDPPDPQRFSQAATRVLDELEQAIGWTYQADSPTHDHGVIRHVFWSDYPVCSSCGASSSYWDLAVRLEPLEVSRTVGCPACGSRMDLSRCRRVMANVHDPLLHRELVGRRRDPVFVYGTTGSRTWRRAVEPSDEEVIRRVAETPLPESVPVLAMMREGRERWGELYRSGYHAGMTHVHHFCTRRNLLAVGTAWALTESFDDPIRAGLRYWISSYNAAHSTVMSRAVTKAGSHDLVLTGAQSGTLYVSSLPVEKNVLRGLRAKLPVVSEAFRLMRSRATPGVFVQRSSLDIGLPDDSVDYVFTDPPFGDNIQYSEVNFISEAWLGRTTDNSDEAIISVARGRNVYDYGVLLRRALSEVYRVLKPGKAMTIVFHSSDPANWLVLKQAWEDAGLQFVKASVLDKSQGSLKQTTTAGSVRGDCLIHLEKPLSAQEGRVVSQANFDVHSFVVTHLAELAEDSPERHPKRLFSRLVAASLDQGSPVPMSAREFYSWLESHCLLVADRCYLADEVASC